MIVARCKVQSGPERADEVAPATAAEQAPSRELPGVIHLDVARSLTDPNTSVEVSRTGRVGAPERTTRVAAVLSLIEALALTRDLG